jgi:tetratricopeptide (TPR) repeat protein
MPKDVRFEERTQELYDYLLEYFREQDNKLGQFRDYRNADELARCKAEADRIMAEAQRLRELREYDKAVALCRKAIEIFPADPEPYLEGGRLLVRKRKYTAALRMFRDAEQVAKNLPAPNQEIGKLRALQAQEYVATQRRAGRPVDKAKVDSLLAEAVESFEEALGKAEEVRAEEAGRQQAARQEATASVVEDILSLGLEEMLAPEDSRLQKLMGLAERGMAGQDQSRKRLAPRQLIQMGLMAFHRGDTAGAVKQLLQAAQDPQSLSPACQKLNFMGTQLRRRGEVDQALKLYDKLTKLEPPFQGFVLFNLAVAQQAKALEAAEGAPAEATGWEAESFGSLLEALQLEPHLVKDPNFYHNTIMLPVVRRGRKVMEAALGRVRAAADPAEERCRRACQQVELLLMQNERKQALQLLFLLARKLPAFFTGFSRYASLPVYEFASGLSAVLLRKPEPQNVKMGRILGLLRPPAPETGRVSRDLGVPAAEPALKALSLGERRRAGRLLGRELYARPELVGEGRLWSEPAVAELVRELYARLAPVRLEAFQAGQGQAAGAK